MRKLLLAGVASIALGSTPALAQTQCTIQTQAQLLAEFSDLAPPGSITPQLLRNFICTSLNLATGPISGAANPWVNTYLPYGWQNTAAGASVIADGTGITGVLGGFASGVSAIAGYGTIDTAGLYVSISNLPPLITLTNPTFNTTHVFPATPLTPAQLAMLKVNMFVLVASSPNYESYITGWAPDGSSITVIGWAVPGGGNPAAGQTPPTLTKTYVGVSNNVFGANIVSEFNSLPAFPGPAGGLEVDSDNGTGAYNPITDTPSLSGIGIFGSLGYTGTGAGSGHGLSINGFYNAITLASIAGYDVFSNSWTVVGADGTTDIGAQSGSTASTPCNNYHTFKAIEIDSALCGGGGNGIAYSGRINALTGIFEVVWPTQTIANAGAFPTTGSSLALEGGPTSTGAVITTFGDTNGKITIAPNGAGNLVIGAPAPGYILNNTDDLIMSSMSTTATGGFLGLPVAAGTPTGVPTHAGTITAAYCMVNNSSGALNCYYGGAWNHVAFSAGGG